MTQRGRIGVTLEAFLAARLDEDEAAAAEAIQGTTGRWDASETDWGGGSIVKDEGGALILHAKRSMQYRHIARHDPGRVLREIEAKRAILAEVQAIPHSYVEDCYYSCELAVDPGDPEERPGSGYCNDNAIRTGGCTCGRDGLMSRLLRHVAAVYADHPDYDPAWAPTRRRRAAHSCENEAVCWHYCWQ